MNEQKVVTMRTGFATTTRGLNRNSPPYRLFEKAKRLGTWNASDIDFSQDRADWQTLNEEEQQWLVGHMSAFIAGEEAVTLDILPLIRTIAKEGRVEEEMFLTTFLFEEAKHVDFFWQFLEQVVMRDGNFPVDSLAAHHGDNYHYIFYRALPEALQALETDTSPAAQVRASVIYNMIIEGVMAESGYARWFHALRGKNIMPGLQQGLELIKRDESRHIAYGFFLLSRLIAADDSLWDVAEATFAEMKPYVASDEEPVPEGPQVFDLHNVSPTFLQRSLYEKRLDRLRRARGASMKSIYEQTNRVIDQGEDGE
ncbi:MAG: R2-like ligand-binding oxidase [Chloroflexota bacterium]